MYSILIMKKIALLNDTRTQFHHGCELVVKQIENLLMQRGVLVFATSNEGSDWSNDKKFLKDIEQCQAIVVNGEGTIHHNRPAGKKLLEVSELAQKLNIPCFLVNTTYQSNPPEFKRYLEKFEQIYVRESQSWLELESLGIASTIVPDLTLSYECSFLSKRQGVGFTDSAMTPISEQLFEYCEHNKNNRFLPVLRSRKYDNKFNFVESIRDFKFDLKLSKIKLLSSDSYLEKRNLFINKTIDSYLEAVSSCNLLVSGRFHSNCFCILTETPFLALEGNSHKVQAMLKDIGLSESRLISLNDIKTINFETDFGFSDIELTALREYRQQALSKINSVFDMIVDKI